MLYLISGSNGAAKTLNTIKMVCEESQFKDRPIYYFNIDGLQLDWLELSTEDVRNWFDLPHGSVILIDECYKLFPTRKAGVQVPEYIQRMAEHRKLGMDLILICQKPVGQIDAFVRGLVGKYMHYDRKFNGPFTTRYTYNNFVDNPMDYNTKREAVIDQIKLDKKYYGVYKSAEIHTHKQFYPKKKLALIALAAVISVGAVISAFNSLKSMGKIDSQETVKDQSVLSGIVPVGKQEKQFQLGYFELHKPRVNGFPHTAPLYDSLTVPKSYPRLQCMHILEGPRADSCVCFTQQATRLNTPKSVCIDVVRNGYFDSAIPDYKSDQRRAPGGAGDSAPGRAGAFQI